jgi:deazaflavin-dependent oxidoreductase (nitroreductase family)
MSGTPASSGSTRPAIPTPIPAKPLTRKGNPFLRSATGGRTVSALMLPGFTLHPPLGYGVLITTGRRTGKTRRRCIHAVKQGDRAYIVMIRATPAAIALPWTAAWMWNIRANPNVHLRLRGSTFAGRARELTDEQELKRAREIYCETVNLFDYAECAFHRSGRPTRAKIQALHRSWFDTGIPVVVELHSEPLAVK